MGEGTGVGLVGVKPEATGDSGGVARAHVMAFVREGHLTGRVGLGGGQLA